MNQPAEPPPLPSPDTAPSLHRALHALEQNQYPLALEQANAILASAPHTPLAMLVAGLALHGLQSPDALATLKQAVELAPTDPQFHYNYAVTLAECGQTDLAMVHYRACLLHDPNYPNALWNYGEMLRLREHFALALALFDTLEAIEKTKRPKMAHRMAVCCAHLTAEFWRADQLFNEQIAADDDALTHWEYALYLLGQGRFNEAWPHYAKRFEAGAAISVYRSDFPVPKWDGRFVPGRLLVVGEQGAGDELLFAAFLPDLLAMAQASNMQVVLACSAGLVSLFQASFAQAIVVAHSLRQPAILARLPAAPSSAPGECWQVMLGDLPLFVPKPRPTAYLKPAAQDIALVQQELRRHQQQQDRAHGQAKIQSKSWQQTPQPAQRKVGLVCSANPAVATANRQSRNVPPRLLQSYAQNWPNAQFFSLQTAEHQAALAHMPDIPVVDMSHLLTDFSRTAALMLQMDVIVTVRTSTANLAGALGCDTRVLLQQHGDWRWWGDTAWYPRVRSYRQVTHGDWSVPLKHLFIA